MYPNFNYIISSLSLVALEWCIMCSNTTTRAVIIFYPLPIPFSLTMLFRQPQDPSKHPDIVYTLSLYIMQLFESVSLSIELSESEKYIGDHMPRMIPPPINHFLAYHQSILYSRSSFPYMPTHQNAALSHMNWDRESLISVCKNDPFLLYRGD